METKRYFLSPTSIHFTLSPNCHYFHCFHPIASEVFICKHINIPWVCFWHAIEQLMLLLPRPTHNYWTLFYLVYFYHTLKDDKFLQAGLVSCFLPISGLMINYKTTKIRHLCGFSAVYILTPYWGPKHLYQSSKTQN